MIQVRNRLFDISHKQWDARPGSIASLISYCRSGNFAVKIFSSMTLVDEN